MAASGGAGITTGGNFHSGPPDLGAPTGFGAGGLANRLAKPPAFKSGANKIKVPKPLPGQLPGTSHLPGAPSATAAGATAAPGSGAAAPAPGAGGGAATNGSGAPSGLDATYYANVNANNLKVGNEINSLNLKGSGDQTAMQAALAQLQYAQPRADLALEQKANQAGALYSSVYGQNLGNQNYSYLGKEGAAIDRNAQLQDAIAQQIAGLQEGIPAYNEAQAAAAEQRSSALAAKNTALGGKASGKPGGTGAGGGGGGGGGGKGAGGGPLGNIGDYLGDKGYLKVAAGKGGGKAALAGRLANIGGYLGRQGYLKVAR